VEDFGMADRAAAGVSAWAPLRVRAFRALWIAQLASMTGTWMQTVGAQWLLVAAPDAATLVALVQTAAMVPTLLLALPAGALADIVDRRRLLIGLQAFQLVVGAALVTLTALGRLGPAALLGLTFLLGCGQALTVPGYQALVQDLVPRAQLRSAAALNGVAMNLARAVGPAVAGLLIARIGVVAVFALNAATFAVFALVLAGLPRAADAEKMLPERFTGALIAGARYVRHAPPVRRMLLRILLFVAPGAAIWALLPLVASQLLGLDATGYGLLLAALGIGAVIGAVLLPHVTARLSASHLILAAGLTFAAATAVCALVPHAAVVVIVLLPAGLAWLSMLATMSGTLQVFLPGWVRARGLAIYQMVFAGGQALAALAWGVLAEVVGVGPTLLTAATLLALGAVSVLVWPLRNTADWDRNLAAYWPEPHLELEPELEGGPVTVVITYTVPPPRVPDFLVAMVPVRRMRLRTGAQSWTLHRDGGAPDCFVEIASYPTWAEHLRQHTGRLTGQDRAIDETVAALAEGPPRVQHLFPPQHGSTTPSP
jgi:MFS family permease